MRVPLAWLRDYITLPADPGVTIYRLASIGFPVDDVAHRPTITGVVVGAITEITKHPNADRLQVCTIDIGLPQTLTIATAATNVALGQVVPVATIGAQLPMMKIEPRTMRGIASQGMLCSAGELGLEASWFEDGIMQLDATAPLGADVVELFRLDDPVLDVDVTPNRADALCMVGLARELAASFGVSLREPRTDAATSGTSDDVRVTLESPDVRRYVAQRASGLRVGPAPAWIRVRLALAGQRPIDNLIDISNFVMLEVGQPLHVFDVERLGGRHVIVRDASAGEQLTTLDGVERALDPSMLVIADANGATAIAGIMGGNASEVSASTSEVLIESANFAGPRVRRASVKLGLRSEASTRNEKNLAPALADIGAARAAYLLAELGATVRAPHVSGPELPAASAIMLRKSEIPRYLGFRLDDAMVAQSLASLGFRTDDVGDAFAVGPPVWRTDIAIAPDVIEEVARVVGYDRIETVLPTIAPQKIASTAFDRENALATTLAGLGYRECFTLGLQPASVAERDRKLGIAVPAVVEISNPLSEDQRFLRYDLLHAHLALVARDRAPRPYRTFEIGAIFTGNDGDAPPRERTIATVVATTARSGEPAWRSSAFLALKSDLLAAVHALTGRTATVVRAERPLLHPGKTAALTIDDTIVGAFGVVDPRLLHALDIADDVVAAVLLLEKFPARKMPAFKAPARFPAVERDIALVLDTAVPAGDLLATVRGCTDVRSVVVFDEYRGAQIDSAKKSLALRIALGRDDATLTDAIAETALAAIVAAVGSAHGATLRA